MIKTKLFLWLQYCLPQHCLSRLLAKLASCRRPMWLKDKLIKLFIRHYGIDMTIVRDTQLSHYACFNDFFIRHLKPSARPIAKQGFVSPVDGTVSQIGDIQQGKLIQAKKINYTVEKLLAEKNKKFTQGKFATLYLSPKDYHRVHMPCDGRLVRMTYVPGQLFSVNQTTAENIDGLFARNERLVCIFATQHGEMAVVMVGAMLVAGISVTWFGDLKPRKKLTMDYLQQNICLQRGDEMGYFKFGSTVVLLLENNKLHWQTALQANSQIIMGEKIADEK